MHQNQTYGLPPIRLAGDGRVGSSAVGRGERNPLKTPGVGCPSCPKGYTVKNKQGVKELFQQIELFKPFRAYIW